MIDVFLDAVFPIFRGGRRRIRLWLHALPGDAVDVGRLIAHHGLGARADVPIIYVIAEDDQNVRFFFAAHLPGSYLIRIESYVILRWLIRLIELRFPVW